MKKTNPSMPYYFMARSQAGDIMFCFVCLYQWVAEKTEWIDTCPNCGSSSHNSHFKLLPSKYSSKRTIRNFSQETRSYTRLATRIAIREGKLIPQKCSHCNADPKSKKIISHHENYLRPFDVDWLCPSCHTRLHRSRKRSQQETTL